MRRRHGYCIHPQRDYVRPEALLYIPAVHPPLGKRSFPGSHGQHLRSGPVSYTHLEVTGALEALDSETAELKEAIAAGDADAVEEELGDLLFSAVNVSRFVKSDAEQALTRATDKFIRRFRLVERLAAARGISMAEAPLEQLDELWREEMCIRDS